MPSPPLTLLGNRYRIVGILGTGGMATVHDAVDERLERPVAVKILRPEMAARPDLRARFEAEARAAARLTHPNVVAVFDSGEDGGVPYLVMEKLPGETLADRLPTDDVDWVLRVAGDVLGALGAAHAVGVVHRDVKPGNVLLAADGCAKVADFGIAKTLEAAAAAAITSTNQLLGTPAYVAPERLEGQPASPRSDLYALGVVLYEALAGRKPFDGATPVAVVESIQRTTPPALADLRADLPGHVVAAVERAMARNPEDRPATAAEMAADLGISESGVPASLPGPEAGADATVLAVPATATQVLPITAAAGPPPATPATPVPTTTTAATPAVPAAAGGRASALLHDRRRLRWAALVALLVALLLLGLALASGVGSAKAKAGGADPTPSPASSTATPTTPPAAASAPPTTAAPPATAPAAPVAERGKPKKGKH